MIREIGGTNINRVATRTFRDEDDGHTIRVTVCGETTYIFPNLPAPNIQVEDLGIWGCAPRPAGTPRAEKAIGRDIECMPWPKNELHEQIKKVAELRAACLHNNDYLQYKQRGWEEEHRAIIALTKKSKEALLEAENALHNLALEDFALTGNNDDKI